MNAAAQRTIPEDIVCPTTCRPTSLDDGTAFLVDKPTGCTSHDVVRAVRRATDRKKVGHAGTLDPLATGLLIILVARPATRLQAAFTNLPKTYTTTVRLGETTPSHDAETDVAATADVSHLSRADVEVAAKAFEGVIDQVPPMYSAVRIDGERLYKKARRGETVDRPPRQVRIDDIEILDGNVPTVTLRVQCSKGTYIRSLARDLGAALNVGAHLLALRRTAIGPYAVEDAWTLDVLLDALA